MEKIMNDLRTSFFEIYENPANNTSMDGGEYQGKLIEVDDINFLEFGIFPETLIKEFKMELKAIAVRWIRKSDLQ